MFRLIQVAPVEVVSICDVDSVMANDAADQIAGRQLSGKRPRIYSDYRKLIKEKDFDIVLIDTPDHWHALPMIEAAKAGADIYVQKPTGVDVVEGQAMLAAARKYGSVVQVGTQRRSTPHLIEARDRVIKEGLEMYLHDTARAWELQSDGSYVHVRAGKHPRDAQQLLLEQLSEFTPG